MKENKNKLKKLEEDGNKNELKIMKRKGKEFYYIEDLTETELNELKKTDKKIYIDQGKTELICALNSSNDKLMYYSGKERGKIIKTAEHTNKINKLLNHLGITKEYEELKELNKKTSNNEELIKTLTKMNKINNEVYNSCKSKRLRKEKLDI